MAKQLRLKRCFRVLQQNLLRRRTMLGMASEHARHTVLLRTMKLLWINTTGLLKISTKRANQFRKQKLQGKVLACLFVSKCRSQLSNQISETVDHICKVKRLRTLQKCFDVLQRRALLSRFAYKRENLLLSKILYQWRLQGKLEKIRSRYGGDSQGSPDRTQSRGLMMSK